MRRGPALAALAVLLAVLGILTVVVKLSRLVGDSGTQGALAITFLHGVTRAWWEGSAVYAEHRSGVVYPPATWVLLGPVFGRTTLEVARWVWAGASLAALAALGTACARAVRDGGRLARACAWLAPFSMPALGDALGIGALITVLLPLAVWSVLVATRFAPTWTSDLVAAGMFDLALADPSLALPFFGVLLVAPHRVRPAALAVAGYGVLTVVAARIQPSAFSADIFLWIEHVDRQAGRGYGNMQDWLLQLGWTGAFAPASLILLVSLGAFTWWCRRSDTWLLLGVSATAARLWMAPRVDCDAMLIIPVVATFRLASSHDVSRRVAASARVTLIVLALVLGIPLNFHFAGSTIGPWVVQRSWVRLFDSAHVIATIQSLCVLTAGAEILSNVVDRRVS